MCCDLDNDRVVVGLLYISGRRYVACGKNPAWT